jgi:hypothetical protein
MSHFILPSDKKSFCTILEEKKDIQHTLSKTKCENNDSMLDDLSTINCFIPPNNGTYTYR